jgi:large exoprotein involved in heme utilization and adhesion
LPSNVVEAKQISEQTCSADREGKANNGLAIAGRGGVSPKPDAPLSSANIIDSQGDYQQTSIPEPIETAQGKIQLARGIKFTKDGRIILTAYPTNNAGERIPEIEPNCK